MHGISPGWLCLGALLALTPPAGAQLVCDLPVYDFGQVRAATGQVQGFFLLRNAGRRPLTIVRVSASCGCMTSELPVPYRLAPGSNLLLTVSLDVRARSGAQRKSAHVSYRVEQESLCVLTLSLCGTVLPEKHGDQSARIIQAGSAAASRLFARVCRPPKEKNATERVSPDSGKRCAAVAAVSDRRAGCSGGL